MKLRYKLQIIIKWLWYEPRHVWLCFFLVAAAIVTIFVRGGTEQTVRIVGMLLQLFGIITIIWGIVETRQFFGMDSPLVIITRWLTRFPLLRSTVICGVASSVTARNTGSARGHSSWPIDPTAPIDQRITNAEKNIAVVQILITGFQQEFDKTCQEILERLKYEEQCRLGLSFEFHSRLKIYGTGGLHIAVIGAVWLFFGTIFGSASPEICALLQ